MKTQINMHRHEIKYYIHKRQAAELRFFLAKYMQLDPNTQDTGSYWIRSLYFDTLDNNDYYEKIIGCNIRKKIRIRIYDIASAVVKLEIKNKYNSYISKETVNITREDAKRLIQGNCSNLLHYNENATNKVFAYMHRNLYRPTVMIDYEREAYLYPFQSIRVTLDKNLRAAAEVKDLYQEDACMIPVFNTEIYVLEVKFDDTIPVFLQKILSNLALQKSQISKYCLSRNILGK